MTQYLKISQLHPFAVIPYRSAAGYDLISCRCATIPPWSRKLILIGIAIQLPPNHYGRIASRSGLALFHNIDVAGGVIDPDARLVLFFVITHLFPLKLLLV
uniref:dUTP diphosphatase n=1 Tax=Halimeda discoidea TaxID=118222 RepID=A0A1C9JB84_9CHLO|nr:hypothetical protein [Halimeda discoidea]